MTTTTRHQTPRHRATDRRTWRVDKVSLIVLVLALTALVACLVAIAENGSSPLILAAPVAVIGMALYGLRR